VLLHDEKVRAAEIAAVVNVLEAELIVEERLALRCREQCEKCRVGARGCKKGPKELRIEGAGLPNRQSAGRKGRRQLKDLCQRHDGRDQTTALRARQDGQIRHSAACGHSTTEGPPEGELRRSTKP